MTVVDSLFEFFKEIQPLIEFLTFVVLILTLAGLGFYTWYTRKLAISSEKQIRIQNQPVVSCAVNESTYSLALNDGYIRQALMEPLPIELVVENVSDNHAWFLLEVSVSAEGVGMHTPTSPFIGKRIPLLARNTTRITLDLWDALEDLRSRDGGSPHELKSRIRASNNSFRLQDELAQIEECSASPWGDAENVDTSNRLVLLQAARVAICYRYGSDSSGEVVGEIGYELSFKNFRSVGLELQFDPVTAPISVAQPPDAEYE